MGCLIREKWNIVPTGLPAVIRNCPKCETKRTYVNTGKFRINANKKSIDVWMIYQCDRCKSTWNMTLYERIHSQELGAALYGRLQENDPGLIRNYAFDPGLYRRNRTEMNLDDVQFTVQKHVTGSGPCAEELKEIQIICDHTTDIRIDKLLGEQLGMSRSQVKRALDNGIIYSEECRNIGKSRVRGNMKIYIKADNH